MTVPTIVCPLCATVQPNAWDCASCGHPLHERPQETLEVSLLDELDTGRAVDAGNIATEVVPEFESTRLPDAEEPLADVLADLETTALAGPLEVEGETMPDIERTALEADGEPTAAAASLACRYCGTPWQEGSSIFCGRCGMRIPAPQATPRAESAASGSAICPGCGTPGQTLGARCASCGQKVVAFG